MTGSDRRGGRLWPRAPRRGGRLWPPGRGQTGIAYVAVLLVLATLTILGLSLVLVTQSEVLSGFQERTMERVFYAAESGLQLPVANALAEGNFDATVHEREQSILEADRLAEVKERVESSRMLCLVEAPCNLCSINQGRSYTRRNHALAANAARIGVAADSSEVRVARKALSQMVDVEPFDGGIECVANVTEGIHGYRFDDYE